MISSLCGFQKYFFFCITLFLVCMVLFDRNILLEKAQGKRNESQQDISNESENIDENSENGFTKLYLNELNNAKKTSNKNCQKDIEYLSKLLENYIQRYINVFLLNSELLDYDAENDGETVKTILEINMTPDELSFLKKYGKLRKFPTSPSMLQRDLSKLDAIFSKMIRVRKKNTSVWSLNMLLFYFNRISDVVCFLDSHQILILLGAIYFIYKLSPSISVHKLMIAVFIAVNCLILYESYSIHKKKLWEAQLKSVQYLEKPDICDPSNRRWYHNVINYFKEDSCDLYYKQLLNLDLEISILQCIIDTYAFYFIEKPFHIFGKVSFNLAKQFSGDLPFFIRGVSTNLTAVFVSIILGLVLIGVVCGSTMKLRVLGAGIEIEKKQSHLKSLQSESQNISASIQSAQKALTS